MWFVIVFGGLVGLFVIFELMLMANFPLNPKHWYCHLFHRRYHVRTGVSYDFTLRCERCGRTDEWFLTNID